MYPSFHHIRAAFFLLYSFASEPRLIFFYIRMEHANYRRMALACLMVLQKNVAELPAFCVHGGKYRPPASLPPMPNFTCKQSQPNMLRYYLSLISLLLFGRRMGLDRVTRKPRQIKLPATPGWWAEGGRTFKAPFFMDPPSVVHVMKLLFYSLFMFLPFNVSDGRTTSRNKGSTHTGGNLHDRQWVGWITLV